MEKEKNIMNGMGKGITKKVILILKLKKEKEKEKNITIMIS